jgi:cell division protein FtsL
MAASISFPALTGLWLPTRTVGARTRSWSGTPEVFFHKEIDNSRLVKVADSKRNREMLMFTVALGFLFLLVMTYAWQHFSAVEYGYRIEAMKEQRDSLLDTNRTLRLEQASLTDPARIDALARRMGLSAPLPGQQQQLDSTQTPAGSAVVAQNTSIAVVASLE